MTYESGKRPTRLQRNLDIHTMPWTAYTLGEQRGLVQHDIMTERHLGRLTSVTVQHGLDVEGAFGGGEVCWNSVMTSVNSPPAGIMSLHDAMNRHFASNTSNHEQWHGDDELTEVYGSVEIGGTKVDAVIRRLAGLSITGAQIREQWITAVVPQCLEAYIRLTIVPLRTN